MLFKRHSTHETKPPVLGSKQDKGGACVHSLGDFLGNQLRLLVANCNGQSPVCFIIYVQRTLMHGHAAGTPDSAYVSRRVTLLRCCSPCQTLYEAVTRRRWSFRVDPNANPDPNPNLNLEESCCCDCCRRNTSRRATPLWRCTALATPPSSRLWTSSDRQLGGCAPAARQGRAEGLCSRGSASRKARQ